jgi:hypothetical protein
MENQVRNKDRITHQKKQERINVRKGNPTVSDITEGVPQMWFIPNKGLFDVANYNNKLYYNRYIESPSEHSIVDADGTLADVTEKFNKLLKVLGF